jgi:hypothetical protein
MLRIVLVLALLLPSAASAQRIHETRTAFVRPATSLTQLVAPMADSVSRSTKIGLWALGGALIVGGVVALNAADEAKNACEDFCAIPPVAYVSLLTGLGAIAGGLLGALIGSIVTSGG